MIIKSLNIIDDTYLTQVITVLTVSLCTLSVGLNLGWANPYVPQLLEHPNNFSSDEVSYIAIISPVGYVIGAPLSGYLSNAIGRKCALLLIALPQITGWLILGVSSTVTMFCIGRIIAGIAEVSVYLLVPMYIAEICDPKIRARLTTSISLSVGIGSVLMNILGTYTSVSQGSLICASVPLAFVLTFMWMPESPYYYIMKNKPEKAEKALQTLIRRKDVTVQLNQLINEVNRQLSESSSFGDIFRIPSNFLAFSIIICIRVFQHYSGIIAFLMYGRKMFQDVKSVPSPSTSAIITSISSIVLLSLGSYLIDRFGRRPLLLISCAGTSIILAVSSVYYYAYEFQNLYVEWIPFTTIMLYMFVQLIGLGVAANVLMGEMLSISVKSKALILINLFNGISMASSTKVFQIMSEKYGYHSPLILFSACSVLGFCFTYFFVPETKGKTLEEIQSIIKKDSYKMCWFNNNSESIIYETHSNDNGYNDTKKTMDKRPANLYF